MELSPSEQLEFDRLKNIVREEHLKRGFQPIDTPLIYRSDVLLAKAGGETEKQIYKIDKGDNDLSLRFDLTVPLARYVVDKQGELSFPFKVSQVAKSYRGERAQFGRYREFYQCDADVVGRGHLDISYDAEVITLIGAIYDRFDLGNFTIRISNRKLLSGFWQALGLGEKSLELTQLVDHVYKMGAEEFEKCLSDLGVSDDQKPLVQRFITPEDTNELTLEGLKTLGVDNAEFASGLDELTTVLDLLKAQNADERVKIDPSIVRGLDYYTGTVFETTLDGREKEVGSVAGGGRYDNLANNYSSETFPGVGVSIGLTRLFSALKHAGVIVASKQTVVDTLILPFGPEQFAFSYWLAEQLRAQGENVDVLTQQMKFAKKMAYADRTGVKNVIVVGESEVETGQVKVKNMQTGEEQAKNVGQN